MKSLKKNNKGFSLVELIIVVAILAVLTALLAPQYFQYIERSRKAVDVNTAAEVLQAVKVAVIDPDNGAAGSITINWNGKLSGKDAGCITATPASTFASGVVKHVKAVIVDAGVNKSAFADTAGVMHIAANYNAATGFTFVVTSDATAAPNRWQDALGLTP